MKIPPHCTLHTATASQTFVYHIFFSLPTMPAASTNDPDLCRTRQPVQSDGPTLSHDATGLIVDFPRVPAPRSVRFSARSLLVLTEPATDEERAVLWYSQREADDQKRRVRRDAIRLARRLASTPASLLRKEDLYHCVGNEGYVSRDVLRSTREHQDLHVRSVLAAQARQRAAEVWDEDELSRLSRASSAPACARAHKIAVGYWDVLK